MINKVAIISAAWQRPNVLDIFLRELKVLINSFPEIEFKVFISVSESESRSKVHLAGFEHINAPNNPLGAKFNAAVAVAKKWEPQYYLCLGSDDIIPPEVFAEYLRHEVDVVGLKDFYFYNICTGEAIYWPGYVGSRQGETCGAGRFLSAKFVERCGKLWKDSFNKGLDRGLHNKILRLSGSTKVLSLKDLGMYAVDVKSETNITKFDLWHGSCYVDAQPIIDKFNLPSE